MEYKVMSFLGRRGDLDGFSVFFNLRMVVGEFWEPGKNHPSMK